MDSKHSAQEHVEFPYLEESRLGYMDFFSERSEFKEPVILADGTSVQFPAGWTDEDADKWREGMELQRPDSFTARKYLS